MKSKNFQIVAVGLLVAPFFIAGWVFASWLSDPTLQDQARAEILIVDPPAQFDQVAQDLGFWITSAPDARNVNRVSLNVRAPKGLSAESALRMLRQEFPGVVLNASYQQNR